MNQLTETAQKCTTISGTKWLFPLSLPQSRILLSTAKLNNFIAQIIAKHLEGSRKVMACHS